MSIEAEKANTNGERIKGNSFSKKMRDVEINGFVKGYYFTIPDTFEVREIVYPNGRAEYIFVTVNGTNDVKKKKLLMAKSFLCLLVGSTPRVRQQKISSNSVLFKRQWKI